MGTKRQQPFKGPLTDKCSQPRSKRHGPCGSAATRPGGTVLTLPQEDVQAGELSNAQLETVLYAFQRFNQRLADGALSGRRCCGAGAGAVCERMLLHSARALWCVLFLAPTGPQAPARASSWVSLRARALPG
jgi:hypothetical protein